MDDALDATLKIMSCDTKKLTVRSSYNLSALSFTPHDIFEAIRSYYPNFSIEYNPDFRQSIADSWPNSVDDSQAQKDWGWQPKFNLHQMTKDMIEHFKATKS